MSDIATIKLRRRFPFGRKNKDIKIQASTPEGGKDDIIIESLLKEKSLSSTIGGVANSYTDYGSQVSEIYDKYNGNADWGCAQTRALIDIRSAFIGGQGISVPADNPKTRKWIEEYIRNNKLNGINLLNWIKGGEMTGHVLLYNKEDTLRGKPIISLKRYAYTGVYPYNFRANVKDYDILNVHEFFIPQDTNKTKKLDLKNTIYIPLGGDDRLSCGPTPRVGLILNELENYDRALKDMRRNNHVLARITPTVKVNTTSEVKATTEWFQAVRWRIGTMFIGTGEFKYETPRKGAHDNLQTEMVATLKTISAVSGMPVHWLGYVDLMSNRSTAESLFEFINIATLPDRVIWQTQLYEAIVDAQVMAIDAGIDGIKEIDYDFEVKIPLIDYSNFETRVKALSLAFHDKAISMGDYRNGLPDIDPLKTKKAVEAEEKENIKKMVLTRPNLGFDENTENDKENNNGGNIRTE